MKKDDYLMEARLLDRKINNKLIELDQLQTIAEGVSAIRYDKDRIISSPNIDRMGDAVTKVIEAKIEINEMIDNLIDKKNEIIKVIEQLKVPEEYDVLHKYYIQGLSWEEIADQMCYSYSGLMKLKNRAISKLGI